MTTQPVSPLFSVQLTESPLFDRAVVEHGDGQFSIAKIRPDLITKLGTTEIEAETTFTFDGVSEVAKMALAGDPKVKENPHAGRQLAAALLIVLTGMGLTKVEAR